MAKRISPGRLIVVEGPDGVGKSTICRHLKERLNTLGHRSELLSFLGREPGTMGDLVYRFHHRPTELGVTTVSPLAVQAMHVAAHIDAVDRLIRPLLAAGSVVVLDRFWWSAWVYGLVSGCDRRRLCAIIDAERICWGSIRPSLAVLVRRPTPIDREDLPSQWQRLVEGYDRLIERERAVHPIVVVDNVATAEDASDEILDCLDKRRVLRGVSNVAVDQLAIGFPSPLDLPSQTPSALNHIMPIRPTAAYDTYWRFAVERQSIFFKRLYGEAFPWTTDPILKEFKFTNAYRASDRVSQYLIRNVIYRADLPASAEEVFFRIMLFKLFNKIETWECIDAEVGPVVFDNYSFTQYDRVLTKLMERGVPIYSAAYIMPSGGRVLGHDRKHRNHLVLLERMLADNLPHRLAEAPTMQHAFALLKSYPSIGDFLAYQYVTDINYSEITDFSEGDFVVPGPGSLDGIRKVFADLGGLNEPEIIKFMAERQEVEFRRLGLQFHSLWGRPLQLIDCQNLFCEVDKYSRVRHPELAGISGRSRIKQRFEQTGNLPRPWYPPKWQINDLIDRSLHNPNHPEQVLDRRTTHNVSKGQSHGSS